MLDGIDSVWMMEQPSRILLPRRQSCRVSSCTMWWNTRLRDLRLTRCVMMWTVLVQMYDVSRRFKAWQHMRMHSHLQSCLIGSCRQSFAWLVWMLLRLPWHCLRPDSSATCLWYACAATKNEFISEFHKICSRMTTHYASLRPTNSKANRSWTQSMFVFHDIWLFSIWTPIVRRKWTQMIQRVWMEDSRKLGPI